MKRVLNAWPYLLAVVAVYAVWAVLARAGLPLPSDELANLLAVWGTVAAPFAVAGAGAVLGWRRGYDGVTVITCLVAFLVIGLVADAIGTGHAPDVRAIIFAALLYTLVGHVGIAAALGIRKLNDPATGTKQG